jgi:hypothetical protein
VCVCTSESGRNKTQLAGKKDSLRGGKKTLAKLVSNSKKITCQLLIPLAFGELASGYPHPCLLSYILYSLKSHILCRFTGRKGCLISFILYRNAKEPNGREETVKFSSHLAKSEVNCLVFHTLNMNMEIKVEPLVVWQRIVSFWP